MAQLSNSNPENLEGPVFVDQSCIDCGTCFHLAPSIFDEHRDKSVVRAQPGSMVEWAEVKLSILSCPTNSIGVTLAPREFREAAATLPMLICDNVYYCGYTARDSFGASSYLIERPEGNVLVDSPRFHPHLVRALEELGGVRTMILTHQDDVADHEKFARHFGCERILHAAEVRPETATVERQLDLREPVLLDPDLELIPTPGHTRGHLVVRYKGRYLFSGDHLFFDHKEKKLTSGESVCWYSWPEQIRSTKLLLKFPFEWIFPGHGGWGTTSWAEMETDLQRLIRNMEQTQ